MGTLTVDVHAHFNPPAYMDMARALADDATVSESARLTYEHSLRSTDPMFTGAMEDRLEMMDAAGIQSQVLSFAAPNLWHPDPSTRVALTQAFNDGCLDICRSYPGRFKLFMSVPLPYLDESAAETLRLADDPDVLGICVPSHVNSLTLDDERFATLFETWDERRLTVFVHPDPVTGPHVLHGYGMEWGLGAPFEDTIAAIRVMRSGMNRRYSGITWIIAHLGGTLPFLIDRIEQFARVGGPGPIPLPRLDLSRVLFDIVTPSARTLRWAREVLGTDRLVFGSDFPYASREDLGFGEQLLREAGFSDWEVQLVLDCFGRHVSPTTGW
jgi:aminocarboxymuconate-semialdehyde decarboxylase